MDAPITGSFRFTLDEFLLAQQIGSRHSASGKLNRFLWPIGPFFLVIGCLALLGERLRLYGVVLIALSSLYFVLPWLQRRAFLKHYSKRLDQDSLVSWEAYPDRILLKTEGASSSTEWRMLARVLRSPQGFLIYFDDKTMFWLPSHSFSSSTDVEAFANLAKTKVQQYKQVA